MKIWSILEQSLLILPIVVVLEVLFKLFHADDKMKEIGHEIT